MNESIGRILISFIFILCLVVSIYGQTVWEKKSYKQWTPTEVGQILNDSPWAQTQEDWGERTTNGHLNSFAAVIRLRSALPIRQAVVRQRMLVVNYDKLSAGDQSRFDAEVKQFLECSDCASNYILTLGSPIMVFHNTSEGPNTSFDIVSRLKDLSLKDLKEYIYLANDKGERRQLVYFIPPKKEGAEAMFVFPRFDEQGKPLLTSENKSFYFKIDEKVFEKRSVPLKRFSFDVSKLLRHGEVIF